MQIAHVLASYEVGGGESVALSLARCQRSLGHNVLAVAFTAPEAPMALRFRAAAVAAHVVPKRAGVDWTLPLRLFAFFVCHRIEVVHTHNPQALVYAAPGARLAGVRLVHTRHGDNVEPRRRMWLRRTAARLADVVVSVSAQTAARARQLGEAASPCVVENGIDVSCFQPDEQARLALRSALGIPITTQLVGTAGRLEDVKNQALIFRALAPLLGPDVMLLVAGDGPRRAMLEGLAGELGHRREIGFLGFRPDMPRVLAALDIFVLGSRSEGLPLVLLEAMATGLPVVSTAVGGIPAAVEDGASGLLVPEGDERRLRESIAHLLADPALRSRLGQRGRSLALKRYSVDRMVARYQELYAPKRRQGEL